MKQKQAKMQAALERVRDLAESWFSLSAEEQDHLREEWSDRSMVTRRPDPPSRAAVAKES